MRAVITVLGKDAVGILAQVSGTCARYNANVVEVTQSIIDEFFTMFMLVNIDKLTVSLDDFRTAVEEAVPGMNVHVMHEDIFDSMHKI